MAKMIVAGGSAGSLKAFSQLLFALPKDFQTPILYVCHQLKDRQSFMKQALDWQSKKSIHILEKRTPIEPGKFYCVPQHAHIYFTTTHFHVDEEQGQWDFMPSINMTLLSAAEVFQDQLIAVILSGRLDDGINALDMVHRNGGITYVQSPAEADYSSMPVHAIDRDHPDRVLTLEQIADNLIRHESAEREAQKEVLGVL